MLLNVWAHTPFVQTSSVQGFVSLQSLFILQGELCAPPAPPAPSTASVCTPARSWHPAATTTRPTKVTRRMFISPLPAQEKPSLPRARRGVGREPREDGRFARRDEK